MQLSGALEKYTKLTPLMEIASDECIRTAISTRLDKWSIPACKTFDDLWIKMTKSGSEQFSLLNAQECFFGEQQVQDFNECKRELLRKTGLLDDYTRVRELVDRHKDAMEAIR